MHQHIRRTLTIAMGLSLGLSTLNVQAKPPGKSLAGNRNKSNRESTTRAMKLSPEMRLSVDSDWFYVDQDDIDFQTTYNGWDIVNNKRIRHKEIFPKAFKMIKEAKKQIFASFFLFDNMYSTGSPESRIVEELTELLINKKKENPDIKITLIFDPLHRGYARRVSPSVKKFRENGIDVFYSDLLYSKSANKDRLIEAFAHTNRFLDYLTLGLYGMGLNGINSAINVSKRTLDGQKYDLEIAFGASLMKANHRKILVTDIDGSDKYESLITSANPHNASDDSTNTSLSIKGDLSKYIYGVLREDAAHSMRIEANRPLDFGAEKYAYLSNESREEYGLPRYSRARLKRYFSEHLHPVEFSSLDRGTDSQSVKARFVSEGHVKKEVLRLLNQANHEDKIRIQMFYLSDLEIVEKIKELAKDPKRADNPIQIILDPSKDAFNAIKDGTPNRQVAHYLLNTTDVNNLIIRWYATHGEQNHAKAMSITNEKSSKFQIITGSTNWTGKNMNDINMEANLSVDGAQEATEKFNNIFDKLWGNTDDNILYTWDYKAYDLPTTMELVLGYEVVKKWDKKELSARIAGLSGEIKSRFMLEYEQVPGVQVLNTQQLISWVDQKFEKDKSAVMREVCLIFGKEEVKKLDDKDKEKWLSKYLNKWKKGEKRGYVAW